MHFNSGSIYMVASVLKDNCRFLDYILKIRELGVEVSGFLGPHSVSSLDTILESSHDLLELKKLPYKIQI